MARQWPQNLVLCALLNTLHGKDIGEVREGGVSGTEEARGGVDMLGRWRMRPMTRYTYFIIVFIGSFLFFFVPGVSFPFLVLTQKTDG